MLELAIRVCAVLIGAQDASQERVVTLERDDLAISESCTVRVPPGLVIPDSNGNAVVHITADNIAVRFEGELRGAADGQAPDEYSGFGIRITGSRVKISGARVSGFKCGIWATRTDWLILEDCDVSGNFRQRLKSTVAAEDQSDWLWPHENDANEWLVNYGAGIYIEDSSNVTVRRCRARKGQNGLCLDRVQASEVYDNDFSFLSGWGIALYRSSGNMIARNACDFCIRGYSHGRYARGQDSAGILMFEQCSDNQVFFNSATHSGDGFFGFAGKEALGQDPAPTPDFIYAGRGNSSNFLAGNDFSYAAAIGIEMTFSARNAFAYNRLVGSNYGIWGGYSGGSLVRGNTIEDNTIAGIAVEHGAEWIIDQNSFARNARAIQFWWDEDKDLLALPWAKENPTVCVRNVVFRNTFTDEKVGIELRGGAGMIGVLENRWIDEGQPVGRNKIDCDDKSDFKEDDPMMSRSLRALDLPTPEELRAPGESTPVGARKHLAGRHRIIMTEWGPYDWESPLLQLVEDAGGKHVYRVLGEAPAEWARASAGAAAEPGDAGPSAALKQSKDGQIVEVTADGEGAVTPYDLVVAVGDEELRSRGTLIAADWLIRVFPSDADPRTDMTGWRAAADSDRAIEFHAPRLDLSYGTAGPSQLAAAPDSLRGANLPADHFGTIATSTLKLPAGRWRFETTSDDGVRLWVEDVLLIDNWTWHAPTTDAAELSLSQPKEVRLRLEHFELDGYATLSLRLHRIGDAEE